MSRVCKNPQCGLVRRRNSRDACSACGSETTVLSRDTAPPGYFEKLVAAIRQAPRLPDDPPGDFPEPPV